MKHYTYRITNIKLNKHYYGTRTSKNKTPEEDLGKYYFSSSSDKEFIKDQKENPQDYKYKVIKKFHTRKEAIELEIKLHNKFNVGLNESFYNRSKQTSTGWDTTGVKLSEETKLKISMSTKNKEFSLEHRKNLSNSRKGFIYSEETKKKMSESSLGNQNRKGFKTSNETKNKLSKLNKGKILSDETKKKMSDSKRGLGSYQAKIINIFNSKDEIVYTSYGNFKELCKENNLPYKAFGNSHRNNGSKLYMSNISEGIAKKNKTIKYKGWYAKYEKL